MPLFSDTKVTARPPAGNPAASGLGALLLVLSLLLPAVSAQAAGDRTLVLGVRADAPPFSSKLDSAVDYRGFSVSLCQQIAQRAVSTGLYCGWKFEQVTAADRFKKLIDGDIHLLCGATTVTLERARAVDFSLLTFISGASIMYRDPLVIPESRADMGYRIGVLRETTTEETAREIFRNHRIAEGETGETTTVPSVDFVTNHLDGLKKLRDGDIDVYLADREILLALRQYPVSSEQKIKTVKLAVSNSYFTVEPYALGINAGNRELRFVTNQVLSELYNWDSGNQQSMSIFSILNRNFNNKLYSKSLEYLYRIQRLPDGSPLVGPDGTPLIDRPARKDCS